MVDWKKILIGAGIVLVVLIILGAISNRNGDSDSSGDLELGDSSSASTPTSAEQDIGLSESDLAQLESDLDALEFEDLGGLAL